MNYVHAIILGLLEGLTEYIPVSSTGHLLLLERFLGIDDDQFGKTFVVLVQLGSILALVSVYLGMLLDLARRLPTDQAARRFVLGVLIAFLPAAVVGVLLHGFIKSVLFNPWIVCVSLIVGAGVLHWADRKDFGAHLHDATAFPLATYFKIGVCQCLAMIPGVSRSGATIVSALVMGADKRAATEFSFFLAMPTMVGAFTYDLWKSRSILSFDNSLVLAVGFAVAFVAGWVVVKSLLGYVSGHGFRVFVWWRLIVGGGGLLALLLGA